MPVRHEIDACAGLVVVYLTGPVTAGEILGNYAAIAADPALRPGLGVLADCREVTGVPSFGELAAVANARPHAPTATRPTHGAVVVSSAWLFGIVRQFAALAEPNGIHVMPFYDLGEAKQWLSSVAETANSDSANR